MPDFHSVIPFWQALVLFGALATGIAVGDGLLVVWLRHDYEARLNRSEERYLRSISERDQTIREMRAQVNALLSIARQQGVNMTVTTDHGSSTQATYTGTSTVGNRTAGHDNADTMQTLYGRDVHGGG